MGQRRCTVVTGMRILLVGPQPGETGSPPREIAIGHNMDYEYIDTAKKLDSLLARLDGVPLLGVDTEAAGYHRYLDRLSLIQISTRAANYLIDPLNVAGLSPLEAVFANSGIEKIFHDADYDLRILDRDARLSVRGLFDTQIAATFLGERSLGLAAIVEKYLGVSIPKGFQRADWAERPLSEGMKEYAAADTAHLPALRDQLRAALVDRGRLAWAQEEFRRRESSRWPEAEGDGTAYLRVQGARDLPPRGLAILRELYGWRERVARERDKASFRVMSNRALIDLSVRPPGNEQALASVTGIDHGLVRRRGKELLKAIRRGLELPEGELPHFPRAPRWERDREVEARVERLREARNRVAEELDLDAGFLMPRGTLVEIARVEPSTPAELKRIPEVRDWQVEAVGEPLLDALLRT